MRKHILPLLPITFVVFTGMSWLLGCSSPEKETAVGPQPVAREEVASTPTRETTPATEPPPILRGIGIIGDSLLDEYRGSDNRGGDYASITFNMVELLARLRNFNLGEWGDWGEPRRTGYEYNWARSGATSSSMVQQGQHTSLAQQVANGEVTFVLLAIGANDFNPIKTKRYARVYNSELSDNRLQAKIDKAIADVTLAMDTILDAGPSGMIVVLFPQWDLVPSVREKYPDAAKRQRVIDVIDAINVGIRAAAAERDIPVVDPNTYGIELYSQVDQNGYLHIAGEAIDIVNQGNEPHHGRLDDDSEHPGTVLSGITANYYFIEPLNEVYDVGIEPLSQEEILRSAGIEGR
jgi:hypothetical protein